MGVVMVTLQIKKYICGHFNMYFCMIISLNSFLQQISIQT